MASLEEQAEKRLKIDLSPFRGDDGPPMARTVYTLTGNLLAERTFTFAEWTPGKTQRARAEAFQVGGKGVNVAKMLRRLPGVEAKILCFVGGAPGAECETWLRAQGLPAQTFAMAGSTRTGLVVRSANQKETTFLGPDVPADGAALQACAEYVNGLPDGSVLALCGSFPGWSDAPAAPLREALGRLAKRGSLYVDTYGAPLEWALQTPATCLKINRDEFELLATGDKTRPLAERVLATAKHSSIHTWVITDGPRSIVFADREGVLGEAQPPEVEEVSATGSGDVFLAVLLHGREIEGRPLADAVANALLYGAANAAHAGIAEFDMNQISTLRSHQR